MSAEEVAMKSETPDIRNWPGDLIAYKWAETLSEGENDVLLASSLWRLQKAIDHALNTRAKVDTQSAARRAAEKIDEEGAGDYVPVHIMTEIIAEEFKK